MKNLKQRVELKTSDAEEKKILKFVKFFTF